MFRRSKRTQPTAPPDVPDVLGDLLRGRGDRPGVAARERFLTAEEIAADPTLGLETGNALGKLFVGLTGARVNEHLRDGVRQRWATGGSPVAIGDDRHIATFAGTRSGKGRGLIIPNLLLYPGSVIVLDPKGDLATETAEYRATVLGQRVLVLDPDEVCSQSAARYRTRWNPLRVRGDESVAQLVDLASMIAESIVVRIARDDSHWDDTASAFIFALVLHVLKSSEYQDGDRTLGVIFRLIMTAAEDGADGKSSTLEQQMIGNEAANGAVAFGASAFYDKEDRERSSVLSTARRHLKFMTYPSLDTLLSGDVGLDLESIQREPTTVYLSIPATKLGVWAALSRMFVNLCLGAFERSSLRSDFQHRTGRVPTLMVLDEFASMGTMTRLADAAGQVAGLGCKLWPILQDMGQLKSLYKDRWETFLANAGVLTFFGNQDLTTLSWIEKRLGQTTIASFSQAQQQVDSALRGGATGATVNLTTHPLLTVPEIARVFNRDDPLVRQLVISAAHGPLILQRAFFDKHELFQAQRRQADRDD